MLVQVLPSCCVCSENATFKKCFKFQKKDFPIVCQRFTTSKLKTFDDLSSIATYGFRGEALASISHIAHITIASATPGSKCAFTARFSDGVMVNRAGAPVAQPTPCAGSPGTRITVEDMFFNVPTRLAALRSATEEYRKVLDVVQRYAVHAAARNVGFTCKKRRGASADVRTLPEQDTRSVIGTLYGAPVAAELRPVAIATSTGTSAADTGTAVGADGDAALFSARGLATHGNWSAKNFTLILFINHRLVQCSSIKRAIEAAYAPYLPKNRHPFVYLSVELPPATVDVNVHPTKREVHFLHEDEIVSVIHDRFVDMLQGGNQSRSFATQAALPFSAPSPPPVTPGVASGGAAPAPSHKVRVDARDTHMGDYFSASQAAAAPSQAGSASQPHLPRSSASGGHAGHSHGHEECSHGHGHGGRYSFVASYVDASVNNTDDGLPPLKGAQGGVKRSRSPNSQSSGTPAGDSSSAGSGHMARRRSKRCRPDFMKPVELDSVRQLLRQVALDTHPELRLSLAEHAFVGVVDGQRSVVQAGTKLLLVSHTALAREMFYQQALRLFANNVVFNLEPPAPLEALLRAGLNDPAVSKTPPASAGEGGLNHLAGGGVALLLSKAAMLREYFGIGLECSSDGCAQVTCLPRLIDGHTPEAKALPELMCRLAWGVEWSREKECFHDVATVLALAYSRLPPLAAQASPADGQLGSMAALPLGEPRSPHRDARKRDVAAISQSDTAQEQARSSRGAAHSVVADVLFPALRRECAPSKQLASTGGALQIACTQQLYRIFERC